MRFAIYILAATAIAMVLAAEVLEDRMPPEPSAYAVDQCIRREVFHDCAALAISDEARWRYSTEDALDQCDDVALKLSVRLTSVVPVECRGVAP